MWRANTLRVRGGADLAAFARAGPVVVVGPAGTGTSVLVGHSGAARTAVCTPLLQAVPGAVLSLLTGRRVTDAAGLDADEWFDGGCVVVEDVQWADTESFDGLLSIAQGRALVVTLRPELDHGGVRAAAMLAHGFRLVEPDPAALLELAATVGATPAEVAQVVADSGGALPLVETLREHGEAGLARTLQPALDGCSSTSTALLARLYLGLPPDDGTDATDALLAGLVAPGTGHAELRLQSAFVGRTALARCPTNGGEVTALHPSDELALTAALQALVESDRATAASRSAGLLCDDAARLPSARGDAIRRAVRAVEVQLDGRTDGYAPECPPRCTVSPTAAALYSAESVLERTDVGGTPQQASLPNGAAAWSSAVLSWAMAEAELGAGRPARAQTRATAVLNEPELPPWLHALARLTVTWAALDLGSGAVVGAERVGSAGDGTGLIAAVDAELAALGALVAGDFDRAATSFTAAAAAWDGCQHRATLRCRWGAAESTRRAGRAEQALTALEAVEAAAERTGAKPLLARVRASQRACGVRRSTRRTATAKGLTRMEQRVLDLMVKGLTNRQISQELDVSVATVDTHVEAILMKSGAQNRIQAVALVAAGRATWQ